MLVGQQQSDIGLQGKLQVEGMCLYLVQPGSPVKSLLAFFGPEVRWDEDRNRLVVHDRSFSPGQSVDLGGSVVGDAARLNWASPPHPSCDARSVFTVGSIEAAPKRPPS